MEAWHGWITKASIALLLGAWGMVAWQSFRTRKRAARSTMIMLIAATAFTALALAWPLFEPIFVDLLS